MFSALVGQKSSVAFAKVMLAHAVKLVVVPVTPISVFICLCSGLILIGGLVPVFNLGLYGVCLPLVAAAAALADLSAVGFPCWAIA